MNPPEAVHRLVEQGWTMAWSPHLGWRRDDAADLPGPNGLTREASYRWALHTSSIQGHSPADVQSTDPLTYMAWCQILGFHPSPQSLRKVPDRLSPEHARPWVPAMILAFRHSPSSGLGWEPDYKRNWSAWLSKRAHLTPEVLLGWGRSAPPWLIAHTEGLAARVPRSRVTDETLWQYASLSDRWPDMPEPVAAASAAQITAVQKTARGQRAQQFSELVNNGTFASWRDLVRAVFGYAVVICPGRGVIRELTGALAGTGNVLA